METFIPWEWVLVHFICLCNVSLIWLNIFCSFVFMTNWKMRLDCLLTFYSIKLHLLNSIFYIGKLCSDTISKWKIFVNAGGFDLWTFSIRVQHNTKGATKHSKFLVKYPLILRLQELSEQCWFIFCCIFTKNAYHHHKSQSIEMATW